MDFYYYNCNMNTFKYSIPARKYIQSGGNIENAVIMTEDGIGPRYGITEKKNNVLFLSPLDSGGTTIKSHVDLCWVLVDVIKS